MGSDTAVFPAAARIVIVTSGMAFIIRKEVIAQPPCRRVRIHQNRPGASNPFFAVKGVFDFGVNRSAVMIQELQRYRIVHFATHGLSSDEYPELSGLVLSLVDERGNPQDGFLRLRDIYNMRLSAELVILSACDTALGKDVKGEGLIGIVRGFMYSGTPRVLASPWKVDDDATAERMTEFYRQLLECGLRPAAALRQAQIAQPRKRSRRSTFYWAAFQLQGEWR